MMILVAGATGATGRFVAGELLDRGHTVKMVVRDPARLPGAVRTHPGAMVITGNILDMSDAEVGELVRGCEAVASCLGHNITLKGVFGHPRRLVTDTTRRLCRAIAEGRPQQPVRFVLMNTVGNSNRDLDEKRTLSEKCVMGLVRTFIPPQPDNEEAADFLRVDIGQKNAAITWVAVRPDSLIDDAATSDYDVYPSPTRSGVFNPGKTSRINVGNFMASLIVDGQLWELWRGQMPVIYNRAVA
jgi:nucleoside-diphosphate-sugar epimerase